MIEEKYIPKQLVMEGPPDNCIVVKKINELQLRTLKVSEIAKKKGTMPVYVENINTIAFYVDINLKTILAVSKTLGEENIKLKSGDNEKAFDKNLYYQMILEE